MNSNYKLDLEWMRRAISLAKLGNGFTSPNPLVGAVITSNSGELISEGFHLKSGLPHAEAMAFKNLHKDPVGGSIYVNLEPCCHHGKTPPCVEKIISSGIKRVFISIKDPDPRVSGKGIKKLKESGLDVHLGLCEKEALEINKAFIHRNLTGNSYGVLKWAMSLDGRTGLKNGQSKWISNTYSRSEVHANRADFDAIVIGGNTLRNDDPLLTSRGKKDPEPLRVVFTKSLNLPLKRRLWDCSLAKTLVVYDSSSADESHLSNLPKGVEIAKLSSDNPLLLSKLLAKRGINKALWECGPLLATAAFQSGCIQETMTYIAPKILGGVNSMSPFSDFNFEKMTQVYKLNRGKIKIFGDDLFLTNKLSKKES